MLHEVEELRGEEDVICDKVTGHLAHLAQEIYMGAFPLRLERYLPWCKVGQDQQP